MIHDTERYARAGTTVRCVRGHPMLRFTRDVYRGEHSRATDLEAAHPAIPDPREGQPIPDCPECGAPASIVAEWRVNTG